MLRFTRSQDGIERATIKVRVRVSRDDLVTALTEYFEVAPGGCPDPATITRTKMGEIVRSHVKTWGDSGHEAGGAGENFDPYYVELAEKRIAELYPPKIVGV